MGVRGAGCLLLVGECVTGPDTPDGTQLPSVEATHLVLGDGQPHDVDGPIDCASHDGRLRLLPPIRERQHGRQARGAVVLGLQVRERSAVHGVPLL